MGTLVDVAMVFAMLLAVFAGTAIALYLVVVLTIGWLISIFIDEDDTKPTMKDKDR